MYKPPFSITDKMLNRVISITQKVMNVTQYTSLERMPILRRNNTIQSIHSSLQIEANSLSLNQVRDVIDGHLVVGPQKDIQEVKNAYRAYEMFNEFNCYKEKDLLKAHGVLTYLIEKESGVYRNHPEGVKDGDTIVFIAPSEKMVPLLMKDLFDWLKNDKETPLIIKSCVFHYEFVFIHPFGDGNGRTARLWQSLILSKWNPIFQYIPVETYIKKYQSDYYSAISKSHIDGNSNSFIEFVLRMIDESLEDVLDSINKESRSISHQVSNLLDVLEFDSPISANEIMARLGIKSKETLRSSYLDPAIKNGLIKMTIPDKPTSKNQKYYK